MVGSIDAGDESVMTERAQLILVGAVAIAVVVLGLVVVFNTVLYTENVASTGSISAPQDARDIERQVTVGSKEIAERTNAGGRWTSDAAALDAAVRNVSIYSTAVTNVTASSSNAFVTVSVTPNTGDAKFGARIRDLEGDEFEAGSKNWSVTDSGNGVIIRDFDMGVDKTGLAEASTDQEVQEEAFRMVWEDPDSGDNHALYIYKTSSDKVAIRTVNNSASPEIDTSGTECILSGSDSESTFEFNLSQGSIRDYPDCSNQLGPWAAIPNESVRSLEFYRADNVTGRYSMVVNDRDDINDVVVAEYLTTGTPEPFWTKAVWEMELTVTYESRSLLYGETFTVEVYNSTR